VGALVEPKLWPNDFWQGRRVLVTGHTGFKGAWLTFWLTEMGALVSGLALPPATQPNLFSILNVGAGCKSVFGDINDRAALDALIAEVRPEVVLHLAAQALVRPSYETPVDTFATNALGTVNLLDALRACPETRSVVVVTSDKVYENLERPDGYVESDELGGHDPYSASKACTEIITSSMRRSFFGTGKHPARIATARAGNVIGGGDWSRDRLVPDIVRNCFGGDGLIRPRNPDSVRPWQHVLEPLRAYLMLAEKLATGADEWQEAWNFGPDDAIGRPVKDVAQAIVTALGCGTITPSMPDTSAPHEAALLALDSAKARNRLGWHSELDFDRTISLTTDWYLAWQSERDMEVFSRRQLHETQKHRSAKSIHPDQASPVSA
jgi:CDP-glucose 4,6-dehydratase